MTGVDFTAHVVGFDLADDDQIGLRCLAENTGGLFLAAADAASLRSALSKTVAKVKEPPAPVVEDPGEATLEGPAQVPAGSEFEVAWTGPDSRNDFITIVEKDAPERTYQNYAYTSKGNPARITAPEKPGACELRYVFGQTRATLGRADITVTPVTATVTAPAEAAAGSVVEVAWEGPNNKTDYVTIVAANAKEQDYTDYVYTKRGSPQKLRVPGGPGDYGVRYVTGQSKNVLATAAVTVSGVSGSVAVPDRVPAGSVFEVTWTGPDYPRDFITIVPPDTEEGHYENYTYTRDGSPLGLTAPGEAGDYEVRYVLDQTREVLAKATITLTGVAGSVEAPEMAPAGSEFEVTWSGPGHPRDYITIVPKGAPDGDYGDYTATSKGNPLSLEAPAEAGEYEVRYVLNASRSVLARTAIRVE